ncbi:MAG: thioredoxin-disulfide reductase [Parcubacteria group bacterium CG_4_9_14_0_2_um_filter_41_8]|nr:MAG: thioredoxin-disulfide reductase [Parcubacteria group bacterium CG22_combo_CG10-13_8_21_14_all_41_9]PIQ80142.1 MAG: thioredoxin-disulfide reductase [Parcubacteria group bacterium CG11_big_fil_rev_8_21_14_0_20_41_14]PIR57572.1 MAG: thioredoxin-disulfide reductase [Parcubacteria group bacterium CG10_big_fil_rev_8_21_14_0_10_41_35]PJC40857.1 MAG: thioredoxin-disulfide reductase [Parcubacteria group bacterium CG_4_9_14_0_2_um_filter_41_8]
MPETKNLIIIGSGPAGYTAGIYASRAQLKPILFTGEEPGGQLTWTTEVENYPGFPEGVQGPKLMQEFRKQAEKFGTEIIDAKVDKVDFRVRPFKVWSADKEYQSRAIIIATGASANWIGLPNETRLKGHGVSSCATCDGFFFKDKDVVVVGGGDVALEDANFLTKVTKSVKIIHRRDCLRGSEFLQKRARENKKISFVWNSEVVDVLGEKKVSGVRVKNNQTNEESDIACDGMFVAIGHHPNTEIFKGQIELEDKAGYIVVHDDTRTTVEGVFAAGDVADFKYRQAVTAAGMGCEAAIDVEKWLENYEKVIAKEADKKNC